MLDRKVKLCGQEALANIRLEIDAHSIGWVRLAGRRMEKVSLSGWEALADVRREFSTHCVGWVSLAERKTER